MKSFVFLFTIGTFLCLSCGDENKEKEPIPKPDPELPTWTVPGPNHVSSENCFINYTKLDTFDIEMNYFLLNEEGEPTTVFKEGENFSICFTITNNRSSPLDYGRYFAPDEIGFIYDDNCKSMGYADTFSNFIPLDIPDPLAPGGIINYRWKWMDEKINKQQPLPIGSYHSGFTYKFNLKGDEYPEALLDSIRFSINFSVK